MIMLETGYLTKENGTWKHFYYLKDHVGSNRLVLDDQGGVVQINNFYPYGLTQAENPSAVCRTALMVIPIACLTD